MFQPEIARIAQNEEKGFLALFGDFWLFLGTKAKKKIFSHVSFLFL
jgi:hypothetical protein